MRIDASEPVRTRVYYALFTLLRPFTLHCTRKRSVAEGEGAQQTGRGVAEGKGRSRREGARRTIRRGPPADPGVAGRTPHRGSAAIPDPARRLG